MLNSSCSDYSSPILGAIILLHVASLLWWGTCWIRVRLEITELRQLGFDVKMIYSTNILSLKADLLKGANNSFTISTKNKMLQLSWNPSIPLRIPSPHPVNIPEKATTLWTSYLFDWNLCTKELCACELCFIWFPLWHHKYPPDVILWRRNVNYDVSITSSLSLLIGWLKGDYVIAQQSDWFSDYSLETRDFLLL